MTPVGHGTTELVQVIGELNVPLFCIVLELQYVVNELFQITISPVVESIGPISVFKFELSNFLLDFFGILWWSSYLAVVKNQHMRKFGFFYNFASPFRNTNYFFAACYRELAMIG